MEGGKEERKGGRKKEKWFSKPLRKKNSDKPEFYKPDVGKNFFSQYNIINI